MDRRTRTLITVTAIGLAAFTALAPKRSREAVAALLATPGSEEQTTEGHYDARVGAAGYAPIVGTFGALAVPAIVVLFTAPPKGENGTVAIAFAAGLLVVAMIGSIIGAISLAAIGGESVLTPNLTSAVMWAAVPVVIALADVVAAFEILASVHLPTARLLLQLITGAVGALGVLFTSLAIGDSWAARPSDTAPTYKEWKKPEWIKSQHQADSTALRVAVTGVLPIVVGTAYRAAGVHFTAHATAANSINLLGLALTVLATAASAVRTRHPESGPSPGPRPFAAYATTLTASAYVTVLVLFLP